MLTKYIQVSDILTVLTVVHGICQQLEFQDQDVSLCVRLRELVNSTDAHFNFFKGLAHKVLDVKERRRHKQSQIS